MQSSEVQLSFERQLYNHLVLQCDAYQKHQELQGRFGELEAIKQRLSEREFTVLELVMAGRLNKTIASELEITVRGVERIRSRLMTKFSANTSAQLVSIATEWKVLSSVLEAFLPFAANDSADAFNEGMGKHR
jgi:FixJ family two-component response regulator